MQRRCLSPKRSPNFQAFFTIPACRLIITFIKLEAKQDELSQVRDTLARCPTHRKSPGSLHTGCELFHNWLDGEPHNPNSLNTSAKPPGDFSCSRQIARLSPISAYAPS